MEISQCAFKAERFYIYGEHFYYDKEFDSSYLNHKKLKIYLRKLSKFS